MNRNLFQLQPNTKNFLFDLDKRAALAIQNHFRLTNYQMLILIWVKGLWTGLLLSLVIHNIISH